MLCDAYRSPDVVWVTWRSHASGRDLNRSRMGCEHLAELIGAEGIDPGQQLGPFGSVRGRHRRRVLCRHQQHRWLWRNDLTGRDLMLSKPCHELDLTALAAQANDPACRLQPPILTKPKLRRRQLLG